MLSLVPGDLSCYRRLTIALHHSSQGIRTNARQRSFHRDIAVSPLSPESRTSAHPPATIVGHPTEGGDDS